VRCLFQTHRVSFLCLLSPTYAVRADVLRLRMVHRMHRQDRSAQHIFRFSKESFIKQQTNRKLQKLINVFKLCLAT
jgi:hypothetical protein